MPTGKSVILYGPASAKAMSRKHSDCFAIHQQAEVRFTNEPGTGRSGR